ncbi:MAG: tetratricopeptide repeat protein [Alphaproteobacteria bacterium]|nr:tetratricopeptide repeat protein [Alphaproteobacteria bacterium]
MAGAWATMASPAWADAAAGAACVPPGSQQGVLLAKVVDGNMDEIAKAREQGDYQRVADLAAAARDTRLCTLPPALYLAQAEAMVALQRPCDAREPLDVYFSSATPGVEGYDKAEDLFEAARRARDAGLCVQHVGGVAIGEPSQPALPGAASMPPPGGDDEGRARDAYRGGELREGQMAYQSGNYGRAAELFTTVISQAPDSFEGYFRRAQAYVRLGRDADAVADYKRAVELGTGRGYIVAEFARFMKDRGKLEYANALYNQYLARNPADAEVLIERARTRVKAGLVDLALEDYGKAIAAKPGNPNFLLERAHLYHDNGHFAEAADDYTAAIAAGGDTADVHYRRGLAYYALGRMDDAVADFTAAIKGDPKLAEAYRGRATVYAYRGNPAKAIADLTALIDLRPEDAAAYVDRAEQYKRQQDLALALADYTSALDIDPGNLDALKGRAILYREQGEYGKALDDLTAVINRDYADADAYARRGWVYYNWRDCKRAVEDFDRALMVDKGNRQAVLGKQACEQLVLDQANQAKKHGP